MQAQNLDHSLWTKLLQKHVSNEGQVHYKTSKTDSKELAAYVKYLSKNTPNDSSPKEEKVILLNKRLQRTNYRFSFT